MNIPKEHIHKNTIRDTSYASRRMVGMYVLANKPSQSSLPGVGLYAVVTKPWQRSPTVVGLYAVATKTKAHYQWLDNAGAKLFSSMRCKAIM